MDVHKNLPKCEICGSSMEVDEKEGSGRRVKDICKDCFEKSHDEHFRCPHCNYTLESKKGFVSVAVDALMITPQKTIVTVCPSCRMLFINVKEYYSLIDRIGEMLLKM